ncbi:MAG: ComEA family DNA-binding protein [Clostridiales bacterium]|nr:ComEA family DNA-binding protein [Clostridiales bacterium]
MKRYIWLILIIVLFIGFISGIFIGRSTSGSIVSPTVKLTDEDIGSTITKDDSSLIDINIASLSELIKLRGIGETLAQRIIDYRIYNGPFKRIDDIKNVTGIGEKLYDSMKDKITVNIN